MSAITPYDWATIAFVIGVTFLCVFMLTVPLLLGGKSWGRSKQEQFESGIVGAGGAAFACLQNFILSLSSLSFLISKHFIFMHGLVLS
jgi:NADH-quinone oxidoreductase subunit A